MKFYYCNKSINQFESVDKETFVSKYNESYFIGNERAIKGVSQNSQIAEDEIERILQNGFKCKEDVIKILAWKIGKIDHKNSEKNNEIIFSKDWKNAYDGIIWRYGIEWEGINEFVEYLTSNFEYLNELAFSDPQKLLCELRNKSPKGIGTVYIITLLYFISKGKYPIYDRFANLALDGIINDKNPKNDKIKEVTLPTKDSKKFLRIYDDYVKPYSDKISKIFDIDYNDLKTYRDVDRALWVYGHAFK